MSGFFIESNTTAHIFLCPFSPKMRALEAPSQRDDETRNEKSNMMSNKLPRASILTSPGGAIKARMGTQSSGQGKVKMGDLVFAAQRNILLR